MKLFHSRTQRAVGQGGFHSGVIDDGVSELRYAYDCGSNTAKRLAEAIRDLHDESKKLDLLFLSHLDQDHANGADLLLDAVEVGTVVLPYLSPFERLALVAETAAQGVGTASIVSTTTMLSAPAAWLAERGAQRVVFVRGRNLADGDPAVPGPPDQAPADEAPMVLGDPHALPVQGDDRAAVGARRRPIDDVRTMPSGSWPITKGGAPIWELVPFVHPEPFRAPAFRTAVAKLLGFRIVPPEDDPKWLDKLKAVLADRPRRRTLANLYNDHIRRDRNLSSMILYSGPVLPADVRVTGVLGLPYHPWHPIQVGLLDDLPIAWIGTGDAHLDRNNRRGAFEQFFGARLAKTGTMMLPHHGSKHNLRSDFILANRGKLWVAAYGTDNSYRHPDKLLMNLAESYGRAVRVTERRRTEHVQSVALEW